jgi:hypothetical protein
MKTEFATVESRETPWNAQELQHERWAHWHIHWTGIWVGGLAAFSMVLLFGLVGTALGAHLLGPEHRIIDLKKTGIGALIFSICGSFFSFAIGGWIAAKIAGILHSEPAMIYGAIVWLVSVPILVATAVLGAGSLVGGWYGGLGNAPASPYVRPLNPGSGATADDVATFRADLAAYSREVKQWNEDTPKVTRNTALGAVTALLLGLVGSVLGGWMGSGEPMNFTHFRTRKPVFHAYVRGV